MLYLRQKNIYISGILLVSKELVRCKALSRAFLSGSSLFSCRSSHSLLRGTGVGQRERERERERERDRSIDRSQAILPTSYDTPKSANQIVKSTV